MGLTFSIIIPTYNRPRALDVALNSLIRLNYSKDDFEIIVVDNYSEIQAKQLIESWFPENSIIKCYYETQNGAHNARNLGAKFAKGEYLVFLDDDCEADSNLLLEYAEVLIASNIKMAGGKIDIKWDEPPPEAIRAFEGIMGKINLGDQVLTLPSGNSVNGGNMVINRDLYLIIGGMEPDQVGRLIVGSGDVGLCRRIQVLGYDIVWVPKALVYHWQYAKINGVLRDLMRREFNNGICLAYEEIKLKKWYLRRRRILWALLLKAIKIPLKAIQYIFNLFMKMPIIQVYRKVLDVAKGCGYVYYCFQYLVCFFDNKEK